MSLDWSIIRGTGPIDFAGNFARGYQVADTIISGIREKQAFGQLAQNPDDRNALAKLYSVNPQSGAQMEAMIARRQAAAADDRSRQESAELGYRFTQDPQGAQEEAVGRGRFDLAAAFAKMGREDQERTAKLWVENIAPVAFRLSQEPNPEKRAALWQQVRPILQERGVPADKLDAFDPQNNTQIEAALATGQSIKDLVDQGKIVWHQVGERPSFATDAMGRPVGSANPYAGRAPAETPAQPHGDGSRYQDPVHTQIAASVEAKHGLPAGLLDAIRTKGERSNADQVSPAGARGVYQFIPETRNAFLQKYGVDAWAGPEQAAEAAALHLKESFERTGSWDAAVSEYIGGTDRRQWGPQTRAYAGRVGQTWDERRGEGTRIETGQKDAATLRAEADAAIAAGADPGRVNARLQEMLGGGNNFSRMLPVGASNAFGTRL